jgi:hypothetical protein
MALGACENTDAVRERAEVARLARAAIAIPGERARINGLQIGSSEAKVVAAFGKPARVEHSFSEVEGKPTRTLYYDGIEIYLVGDEIYGLECRSPVCVTHDGIRPGDARDKVVAATGPGSAGQRDDGTETLRYPVIDADVALIVDFRDGRVSVLTLFFDYV